VADAREEAPQPVGPFPSTRLARLTREGRHRRALADRLTARAVVMGGILVIAAILAILIVIVAQVLPLFRAPSASPRTTVQAAVAGPPLGAGIDEHRTIIYLVTASGVQFVSAADGATISQVRPERLGGARIVAVSALGRGQIALGLSDGRIMPVEVKFAISYPEGTRKISPELVSGAPISVAPGQHISHLAFAATRQGPLAAVVTGPRDLAIVGVKETTPLVGPPRREATEARLVLPFDGEITQIVMDGRGEYAYAGSSTGEIVRIALDTPSAPRLAGTIAAGAGPGDGISALSLLLGDRTLLVGDERGRVTTWLILPDAGPAGLMKAQEFVPHGQPVTAFAPSRRDKGFLSLDAGGVVHLNYATTGRTLLQLPAGDAAARSISYAPKADGFVTVTAGGEIRTWDLWNPHPQVTLRTLFGKTLYEGYGAPAHVWQSTGATDDFEEKLGLTPLMFGTVKATFYSLLIAVPLAILGAIYASQFMHPALKASIKPVVEIMAGLPSVVLGFLAGLWMAPMLERVAPGVFLLPVVVSALVVLTLVVWRLAPPTVRRRLRPGAELVLLVPIVALATWMALRLGMILEAALLGGDFRAWLLRVLGITYEQRNSLVIGLAMGFAVIPIIFSIAEDSLSNVPAHLSAASLALGATRWQTVLRVVLPTASPGIFSAVMIGFGRVVGETMIVLMATGNTPIMDWSIFNGFRALSANIAVELPEAPVGGTLYRVIFLAAFLLFAVTFLVNTIAEVLRLRLRKRYQTL
jgi:phosphate transport system permease protein